MTLRRDHLVVKCPGAVIGLWAVVLGLVGSICAQTAPAGKVLVYKEVIGALAGDQRGDLAQTNDRSRRAVPGVNAINYSFTTTSYWVFDIVNNRHARIRYGAFPRAVPGPNGTPRIVLKKLFEVDPVLSGLPFAMIPAYPAPTEHWVRAAGEEKLYQHQTAGFSTPTDVSDDAYAPELPMEVNVAPGTITPYRLFGLTGATSAWSGRASERPLTLAASKLKLSLVAAEEKAVFPEVISISGVQLYTEMMSNLSLDASIGFPGYSYTSMSTRFQSGRLELSKDLTYKSNVLEQRFTYKDPTAYQGTTTVVIPMQNVEGTQRLISLRLNKLLGYQEGDLDPLQ
jgi:hypothetical protein